MKFISEGTFLITCKCENCEFEIPIPKNYCKQTLTGYKTNKPLPCKKCGTISDEITKIYEPDDDFVRCPKCQSAQLTASSRGFGLGKAAVGGVLLGPVGLLGGVIGSKKTMISCLKCGHKWEVGK